MVVVEVVVVVGSRNDCFCYCTYRPIETNPMLLQLVVC